MEIIRTYSELITLPTFEERFRYLQLNGTVGSETFGYDRFLNQYLYQKSQRWRTARDKAIIRDYGCDLAVEGYDIRGKIIVHHMNPITVEDILNEDDGIFDLEYLICTSHNTHNAIHYGDEGLLITTPIERTQYDTCPWKRR